MYTNSQRNHWFVHYKHKAINLVTAITSMSCGIIAIDFSVIMLLSRAIDKAFRIATPMRKASWTKRFAGGWGERRGANGDGGSGGEGWREWAGGVSEKSLPMRSVREAAPSLAGRRGARVSESAFQVTCPSGSRHAETRILAKEPRPATTAVGTSRQGRVVIRRLVDSSIGRFRQLAQRLRET